MGDIQEIIGYAEPWISSPGDTVDIKVSSTETVYDYKVVRMIQGFDAPHAPKVQSEEITGIPRATVKNGRYQVARPGSYATVEIFGITDKDEELDVSFHVQPYLTTDAGHLSVLVSTLDVPSKSGFAVLLTATGIVEFWLGTGSNIEKISTGYQLNRWRWHAVTLNIRKSHIHATIRQHNRLAEKTPSPFDISTNLPAAVVISANKVPLTFAAGYFSSSDTSEKYPSSFFNGRLDSPVLKATSGDVQRTLAEYDFAVGITTDTIHDVSGAAHHGSTVNAPTRAIKGYDWDGTEPDWTKAKYGYGAIHFHEEDLDDAGWETDFSIKIPEDSRSGAYSVEISTPEGRVRENVTFFVRPSKTTSDKLGARVALILSTFTYLAYANEHMYDDTKTSRMTVPEGVEVLEDENYLKMSRRSDLGLAMYDVHRDGSGTVFSSAKRPILNVRPGYVHWSIHRPREFSADLLMIGYLERLGIPYDITYDHDLHLQGYEAISRYHTVITGCHPEYPTVESLNAYSSFAKAGGNIMYLGGNGFYWTSVTDPKRPHRIEVRRGDQGCRSFSLPPGERIHSLDGSQGGLWRGRGRAPNYLFGIGSDAFGIGPGVPYARTDVGKDPKYAWVFKGIGSDELIGEKGFGGGASGDEIDRLDFDIGSPSNTVLLATSTGHDDTFALFNEEQMFPMVNTLGTQTDKIRSDMTYYETSGNGAVFSVGSINWYCSLGWDDYQNNVALLTGNVLKEFDRRAGH